MSYDLPNRILERALIYVDGVADGSRVPLALRRDAAEAIGLFEEAVEYCRGVHTPSGCYIVERFQEAMPRLGIKSDPAIALEEVRKSISAAVVNGRVDDRKSFAQLQRTLNELVQP